jgi:N-acetyl-gamma-glutamyl-phosphate reductase
MNNYSRVTVGVAGATGYAGVELVRRLARHPCAELTTAMASSGSEARRIPALARIWDAPVQPLDADQLATPDAVFLAVPETLARSDCAQPTTGSAGIPTPMPPLSR